MLAEWNDYPLRNENGHTLFTSHDAAREMAERCAKAHPECVFTIEASGIGYILVQDVRK